MTKTSVKRYALFWLYTIFALVIPCVLIAERYGLFKAYNEHQFAFGGLLILCITLFYFRKHIGEAIINLPPCTFKYIALGVKELMPLICMYVAFLFVKLSMDNITFVMLWSCVSNAVALVFRTMHLKMVEESKIEETKDTTVE